MLGSGSDTNFGIRGGADLNFDRFFLGGTVEWINHEGSDAVFGVRGGIKFLIRFAWDGARQAAMRLAGFSSSPSPHLPLTDSTLRLGIYTGKMSHGAAEETENCLAFLRSLRCSV